MKLCKNCGAENDHNAKYCCECGFKLEETPQNGVAETPQNRKKGLFLTFCYRAGRLYPFIKKVVRLLLYMLIAAGIGFAVWYNSLPDYHIFPETSKITFESGGGSIELPITTDADYGSWHIGGNSSWYEITKNANSITIECKQNDSKQKNGRSDSFYIYCDGRNKNDRIYIKVVQEESEMYVFGDILEVTLIHNQYGYSENGDYEKGLKIRVKCKVRNNYGTGMKCAVWFYDSEGNDIHSKSNGYSTSDNQLTVQEMFYPSDNNTENVELFIPNSLFPVGGGMYGKVSLIEYRSDEKGCHFESDKTESFNVTK